MTPADRWRLQHMADAAELALRFIDGRTKADLPTDAMLRLALTRAVEIVGMRNRLVHAYFDVDTTILWDTVELALPGLRARLLSALQAG